jgi:hypothetical protein
VLVEEFQIDVQAGWQGGGAPAEDDWPHEQGQLVDQPGLLPARLLNAGPFGGRSKGIGS